jgi:flavodoxin I
MYQVIYFSIGGNTMKVAAAIASELNVKARKIKSVKTLPEGAEIFLGSGLYFMRPSKIIRDFINSNDFRGKKVALFGTSTTGIGLETMGMEKLLKQKGAIISGKYYCPGQFRLRVGKKYIYFRKFHPADKDLERAKAFARSITHERFDFNLETINGEKNYENRVLSRV